MFNAEKFLGDYGIGYWTEGKNVQDGWINIRCPVCDDHSNHGGFNPEEGYYNCWRCGSSSIPWVIKSLLNSGYNEAVTVYNLYTDTWIIDRSTKPNGLKRAFEVPGKELESQHYEYLQGKRGLDAWNVGFKYMLRGTPQYGEMPHRIVVPVMYQHRAVNWQARTMIDGVDPKYKNAGNEKSILPMKEVIYNLDNCQTRVIGIVEGVVSVWRLGDNFGATFGANVSDRQLLMLTELFDKVVIVFDPDEAGRANAAKMANKLAIVDIDVEIVGLDKDLDDMNESELDEVRGAVK